MRISTQRRTVTNSVSKRVKAVVIVVCVVIPALIILQSRWWQVMTTAVIYPTTISPAFTPSVQHWGAQIDGWAQAYGLDPNMVATVMQIESCGDPQAVSGAGAQGLFQVMPFHFAAGENSLDPNTNAQRGVAYLRERLDQAQGDVGPAFAGYNGGQMATASSWSDWAPETQRYYQWSTGIYAEVSAGINPSPTLQAWLDAGGRSLCQQAQQRLGN